MKLNTTLLAFLMLWATPTPVNAGLWSSIRNSALFTAILGKTHNTPVTNQTRLPVIEAKLSFWQRITNFFAWRNFSRAQKEQVPSNQHSTQTSEVNASALSHEAAYEQQKQKALAALQSFENQLSEFSRRLDAKLTTSQNKIEDLAERITILKKSRSLIPQLPVVVDQPELPAPRGPQIDHPASISATLALQSDITGQSAGLLQSVVGGKYDQRDSVAEEFAELSHTPSPELLPTEQIAGSQSIYDHIQIDPAHYLAKAQKGKSYLEQIKRGNFLQQLQSKSPDEHLEIIETILYRLHQSASYKGQAFLEGTYVIQDTENFDVFNTLMSYVQKVNPEVTGDLKDPLAHVSFNPFAYSRDASHYVHNKDKYRYYGIDLRRSDYSTFVLPGNHAHLLVGYVDKDKKLFFIKPEHKGIYILDGWLGHCNEFLIAQCRKNNLFGNCVRNVAQLFGYEIWTDDNSLYHKERIPAEFIKQFGLALAQEEALNQDQKEKLKTKAKTLGIQTLSDAQIAQSVVFQRMKDAYCAKYDHIENRTGREVHSNLDQLIALEQ